MSPSDHDEIIEDVPFPDAEPRKHPVVVYAFAAGLLLMVALLVLSY